ncbi:MULTISPECIES: DUF4255 domain-containing protein [unclassified Micromonospora]|uniref:DUF4255 domain-containing protein n=1 Tax=unclassified Micromonospora TaxID=2617518 RepID=UPI0010350363|nr:DUF4255 domain-containing protein [Verrucosispora sp. SN26_14.1]TBL33557.1 DUF4255 domain-containing protein [Verrucosispora sp. SN26_14.1]
MIHEIDEALRGLVATEELTGTGVEVSFDAPTRDWATRRNAPTVNLFLYDIREDRSRYFQGRVAERDATGQTVAWHDSPHFFALSYLVTAWTNRPTDEHRLLATLLAGLIRYDELPAERMTGSLAALGLSVPMSVAAPPGEGRALADVWTALGGELKPSLDLVVTAPVSTRRSPAAPPVRERTVQVGDLTGARVSRRTHTVTDPRRNGDGRPAGPDGRR